MNPPKVKQALPRLRVLWSFARPHRGTLALGLALSLIGSAATLATPMVTKWVLDSLGSGGSLAGPVGTMLALLVAGVVIWTIQWVILGELGERVVLDARESMVKRLLRATVPAVTGRPGGELVTRVTSDTVLLREAASSSVIGLVNGTVTLVGTLVLMAVLDLALLGATVVSVVVLGVVFAVLMPAIAREQELAQDRVGKLGGVLEGTLRAIRTVKASRAEARQTERVLGDARAAYRHSVRAVRREALAWTVAWSGIQFAIILVLGLGAWRVSQGSLEVSSLIAFLLYAFGLMDPVTELSRNVTTLQAGIAAAGRIRDVDALDVERDEPGATAPGDSADAPILELRGVVAGYGGEPAVRGVDLVVPRRGHTAVVGPSGAGKTTLLSLVLRFLEPSGGELLLGGRPYREHGHSELRARLAYVEQETPVLPGTIRDNLLFTHPDAGEDELWRVLREVRLEEVVAALPDGLDTPLGPSSMSGGQRQRIALARAVLRAPDVLLLDEATAQVDGLTEAAVHECVRERARHGAVVTVAHRLSTVIDADTIVVMEDGRVRASGAHAELLATDELYRELVAALRISDGTAPAPAVVA
ncbi:MULTISPECIES: ABC transporter ATP-binding protein [Actinosynnema]|uniref:ABC transporter ATP-binding protein n=1 Tax=Actinosynnema TaxID=40566 RepID=UPI0020A45C20|nr:ABC transporter ATP-binding protein [Actinosynnema pretiosum]MCP2092180.1 ATP-binding cassette, subfamily B [Actinosynnema pretiosum]